MIRILSLFASMLLLIGCTARHERVHLSDRPAGGDFEIASTQGSLKTSDLRGKVLFIYFGFLSCHSVCPMTLQDLSLMVKSLTEAERKNVRVLFISVDNEDDTIDALAKRMKALGPEFIGATDTTEKLVKISALFGGRFSRDRVVDHSSSIYIVNAKGDFVAEKPFDTSVKMLTNVYRMANSLPARSSVEPVEASPILLVSNTVCDLAKADCESNVPGYGPMTLGLSPRPVSVNQKVTITLKANSDTLQPVAVDFEGVNLNMGYIRPALKRISAGEYTAEVTLPACELAKMEWRARPIFKKGDDRFVVEYRFTTSQ